MKARLKRWLFLRTLAFNILALSAGIMGFLPITEERVHPNGADLFFAYVLLIAPILSIMVLAQYHGTSQTDPLLVVNSPLLVSSTTRSDDNGTPSARSRQSRRKDRR